MTAADAYSPRHYPGVMVSSTFQDFTAHRDALMRAISGQGLHPVAMEQDSARPAGTVIDSSLEKVRDATAYVGIIGHRYGNVPSSPSLNPDELSLTEMEFREARRLGRPILLFVMGPDHEVKPSAIERDAEKFAKLEAFRADAKRADGPVHRVYKVFNSLSEFEVAVTQSVAELRRHLDTARAGVTQPTDGIPRPPALYAKPHYIGSHTFVGRTAQLETLNDWASPADPHPVLLFEAIGGSGKSMLTWEWTTRHASAVRPDWAGHFWYSFYEKGAVMADFCRRALSYMTGQPLRALRQKRRQELTDELVRQLRARPWLLILDGLERVLVAYHRYDAAQLADEEAGRTDEIAERDPCAAIRPEDDDLLRLMAGAGPSKVLVTSRLVPRVLLNPASQAIPGVLHERLPGLRPADAEVLLRTCDVRGDSERMQDYLRRHCDCHPLVIGIVAGLVNDYLPSRGDFDAWAADPDHGGGLDLADVGLAMKRNRILTAALESLTETSRQLLLTLALLPQASDYAALEALNPHRPPEPAVPPEPTTSNDWKFLNDEQQGKARARYAAAMRTRLQWETRDHAAEKAALARTVRDLEQRGLMQYDKFALRYDLHPVVRAVASGGLRDADRDRLGRRVVDYFSTRRGNPHELAQSLDDLRPELTVVHTLLRMGRLMEAFEAYADELGVALLFNLEAYTEVVSLLRPFFGSTWTTPAPGIPAPVFAYLGSHAASAFNSGVDPGTALAIYTATLPGSLARKDWMSALRLVFNIGITYQSTNRLAAAEGCLRLAYRMADTLGDRGQLFWGRSNLMDFAITTGRWVEADELWRDLDPMGRQWSRTIYRPGDVECSYVSLQYRLGRLTETELAAAEALTRDGLNRGGVRSLHNLRGRWMLDRGHYAAAAESLREALRMEREITLHAPDSEAWLALASVHLGQKPAAHDVATRLSGQTRPPHLPLSELWHALGEQEQATTHALAAYEWAWADGEPYVRRFELDRSAALLKTLGVEPPVLPPYDPARDREMPWEADVNEAIEELQRGREADT